MNRDTCSSCAHAIPSESIHGMIWCQDNRASPMRGVFSFRVTSLAPSREACDHFKARKDPLVFPTRALPAPPPVAPPAAPETDSFDLFSAPRPPAPPPERVERSMPGVEKPAKPNDDFPKDVFL